MAAFCLMPGTLFYESKKKYGFLLTKNELFLFTEPVFAGYNSPEACCFCGGKP